MDDHLQSFLARNQLDTGYIDRANRWFKPLLLDIAKRRQSLPADQALIVGVSGCQGSGKSTLADYLTQQLTHQHQLQTAFCSIDDFYLSRSDREQLADDVHPLLATRGVPGTHRVRTAIDALQAIARRKTAVLPIFDKTIDDISQQSQVVPSGLDVFIFEGWCIGATPQPQEALSQAINSLEASEDTEGQWRRFVNQQLQGDYARLFQLLDCIVMLQAPSFDTVARWRLEQEQKLARKMHNVNQHSGTIRLMGEAEIHRFVQFYQRVTEHLLQTLPLTASHVYLLDENRQIQNHTVNT